MTAEQQIDLIVQVMKTRVADPPQSLEALDRKQTPPDWVPVIIDLLPVLSDKHLLDACVRLLIDPVAKGAAQPALISLFHRLVGTPAQAMVGWTIGNAIHVLGPKPVAGDVVAIALDQRLGIERQMFVASLARLRNHLTAEQLAGLLKQPIVALHAVIAARAWKDPTLVEPLTILAEEGGSRTVRLRAKAAVAAIVKAHG